MTPTPPEKFSVINGTPRDLPQALHHVLYEMRMLFRTRDYLRTSKQGTTDHNAALESFLMHARCLDEFFTYPTDTAKNRGQNMRAVEFVKDGFPATEHTEIERICREIAHLGWDRKSNFVVGGGWNTEGVIEPIAHHAIKFLRAVEKDADLMVFDQNDKSRGEMDAYFAPYLTKIDWTNQEHLPSSSAPAKVSSPMIHLRVRPRDAATSSTVSESTDTGDARPGPSPF